MDFELRGHTVFTAFDGEEAEQSIKEKRPEIVILDVMMPKKWIRRMAGTSREILNSQKFQLFC